MQKQKTAIIFQDVALTFDTKSVLQSFSLSIKNGEKVVVMGKSGIGKSTLLKLLLGFEKPDQGTIIVRGKSVCSKNIWWVRKQMAYIDQDVMMGEGIARMVINEFFSFKANHDVEFSNTELKNLLDDFSLDQSLLDKDISQLSGGERQRLAIVVALLLKRPIMVLDEVTSALDPVSKKIVIQKLLERKNLTLLVVSHDAEWQKQSIVKKFDFKDKKWVQ